MDVDEIKPCPFCGGVAQRVDIPADEHDPNAGGSYIACKFCLASSSIAFGDKSSLVDNWNTRADDARIRAEAPNDRDGAITWSSFEVGMLAAMMTGNLEKDTATLAMYLLDEPKEREAEARSCATCGWDSGDSCDCPTRCGPSGGGLTDHRYWKPKIERRLKERDGLLYKSDVDDRG